MAGKKKAPYLLFTEVSINLADDVELMQQMSKLVSAGSLSASKRPMKPVWPNAIKIKIKAGIWSPRSKPSRTMVWR